VTFLSFVVKVGGFLTTGDHKEHEAGSASKPFAVFVSFVVRWLLSKGWDQASV
jgi:hypothetical protein